MSTLTHDPVAPSQNDMRCAKASSRNYAPFRNRSLKVTLGETDEQVELPAAAVRLLVELLRSHGGGKRGGA